MSRVEHFAILPDSTVAHTDRQNAAAALVVQSRDVEASRFPLAHERMERSDWLEAAMEQGPVLAWEYVESHEPHSE